MTESAIARGLGHGAGPAAAWEATAWRPPVRDSTAPLVFGMGRAGRGGAASATRGSVPVPHPHAHRLAGACSIDPYRVFRFAHGAFLLSVRCRARTRPPASTVGRASDARPARARWQALASASVPPAAGRIGMLCLIGAPARCVRSHASRTLAPCGDTRSRSPADRAGCSRTAAGAPGTSPAAGPRGTPVGRSVRSAPAAPRRDAAGRRADLERLLPSARSLEVHRRHTARPAAEVPVSLRPGRPFGRAGSRTMMASASAWTPA